MLDKILDFIIDAGLIIGTLLLIVYGLIYIGIAWSPIFLRNTYYNG